MGIQQTKKAVYQALSSDLIGHLDYMSAQMGLLVETDDFKRAVEAFTKEDP